MSASMTTRALLSARNITKVPSPPVWGSLTFWKLASEEDVFFWNICSTCEFVKIKLIHLNFPQVPNRGKALEGWTRPSIDEMGVPTESWAKVNRWYHGGGGHELDSRHVDHADEEGDGEEMVVIRMVVVRTPAIVSRNLHFNQTMPTLVLDLESCSMCCYLTLVETLLDQWGILKHFPQCRCIFISHWSREK